MTNPHSPSFWLQPRDGRRVRMRDACGHSRAVRQCPPRGSRTQAARTPAHRRPTLWQTSSPPLLFVRPALSQRPAGKNDTNSRHAHTSRAPKVSRAVPRGSHRGITVSRACGLVPDAAAVLDHWPSCYLHGASLELWMHVIC